MRVVCLIIQVFMSFFAKNSPIAIGLRLYPLTLLIMTVCILLFLIQIITGVDASNPTNQDLVNLGYGFLVSSIDNTGHIGGAMTGMVLGLLYVVNVKFAKNKLSFSKSSPFMLIGQGLILAIFSAI